MTKLELEAKVAELTASLTAATKVKPTEFKGRSEWSIIGRVLRSEKVVTKNGNQSGLFVRHLIEDGRTRAPIACTKGYASASDPALATMRKGNIVSCSGYITSNPSNTEGGSPFTNLSLNYATVVGEIEIDDELFEVLDTDSEESTELDIGGDDDTDGDDGDVW
jgi:hypothetical protein